MLAGPMPGVNVPERPAQQSPELPSSSEDTRQAWLGSQEPIGQGDEGRTKGQPSPRGSANVVPDTELNIAILCQVILPSPSRLEAQADSEPTVRVPRWIFMPSQPQTLSGSPHFDPKPWQFRWQSSMPGARQGHLVPALHSQSRRPLPGWFK